jgi:AraC-like DNA-binding protein
MSYACSVFIGKSKVDWRQFVMKNGFYDQAHFIKEFKEFIGCSPQEYYTNNQESSSYLKSKLECRIITRLSISHELNCK